MHDHKRICRKHSPPKKINVNAPTTTGTYYFPEKTSTATHLDLRVKDTPQSISVITSQLIKDAKLESITDVVKQTAGLSAKDIDSSRQKFTARGFEITNLQVDGAATSWTGGFRAGESQTGAPMSYLLKQSQNTNQTMIKCLHHTQGSYTI